MNNYNEGQQSELYSRIIALQKSFLIKVSTFVLTDQKTRQLNTLKIDDVVNDAANLHHRGRNVALVTSGAIGTGKAASNYDYSRGDSLAIRQALAAIGQPNLMHHYKVQLSKHGINGGQILLSYDDLENLERKENFRNSVHELWNRFRAIPILNENDPVATEEIKAPGSDNEDALKYGSGKRNFGDNDLLSAMAASALETDVMIMLSEKDGFLRNGNGSKFNVVDDISYLWEHVTDEKSEDTKGGMKSKLQATEMALKNGIYVIFLNGKEERVVRRILEGEPLGTLFLPQKTLYMKGSN